MPNSQLYLLIHHTVGQVKKPRTDNVFRMLIRGFITWPMMANNSYHIARMQPHVLYNLIIREARCIREPKDEAEKEN